MDNKKKRYLFMVNFGVSAIGIAFISAALGTEYWVRAKAIREINEEDIELIKNKTDGNPGTRLHGILNIGLFTGYKEIDFGFGLRKGPIKVDCEAGENLCAFVWADKEYLESQSLKLYLLQHEELVQQMNHANGTVPDHGMFNLPLWVSTIVFATVAIVWGIIAMIFAAINAGTRPIETITGPLGLYIWNSLAAGFSLLCMVMYIVLFTTDLSKNVMSPDDLENLWSSDGMANLDYSFYFILIATVMFLINILLLVLLKTECKLLRTRFSAGMGEKAIDGVMMY